MNNNYLYHYGVPGMKWGVRRKIQTSINDKRRKRLVSEHDREAEKFKREAEKYETRLGELKGEAPYKAYNIHKEILEEGIQAHREAEKIHRTCSSILSKIDKDKLSSMTWEDFDRYKKICTSELDKIAKKYRLDDDFSSEELWMLSD